MLRKSLCLLALLAIVLAFAAPTHATTDLSSYSIFATNSTWVRQNATVNSGNIGVQDASPGPWLDSQSEVTIGKGVYVADGITIYGDSVKIKMGGSVEDVSYNELVNNGTIRGYEYTPLALPLDVPLPEFPTPAPGTEDYDIPRGETLILDAGSYGEILVRANATLILTGGTYHLENLDLGYPNARVLFEGPTDVIINNRLGPGQNAVIGPDDGSGISARDIQIYVNGINGSTGNLGATPKAAEIGYDNTLKANIYAPHGTLLIKQGTVAEGAFIGKDVQIGIGVEVTLNSGWVEEEEVTVDISANPETIAVGDSSTLSWTSTNADSASIDQGIGDVPVEGSTTVSPAETTTYTITAVGPGGSATDSVTVTVVIPPDDVHHGISEDDQQGGAGLVGETICILNGTNVESRSDLSFPSPNSLGLSFEAYYNSRSETVGPLGYGWTHTYDASLDPAFQIEGKEFVKVIDHTGRAHYFLEDGAGFYRGAFKEPTHVRVEAGDYVWYRLDGTTYGFSSSGELIWIEDEKGNRLELTYNGQGRLDTVTDVASSRVLIFYHYGDGLLDYIEGPVTSAVPDGIWVTYGYDASQNLTSVSYADGSGFTYTYADPDDIHNLTQKRDKLDHLLNTWSYDAQDRAVDNFSAEGKGVNTIAYVSETQVDVTDAYGTLRTYILGEIGGRKRVSAIQGIANAPYSESNVVSWVYDDKMRLIEVETAGGTINQYQDYDERGNPGTVRLAVGAPEERVISYTYHPEMNVPLSRTELSVLGSGNKLTIWDYDDDYDTEPNENPTALLSRIVEQGFTKGTSGSVIPYEYITAFTYNSKGQVLTIDGALPGIDGTTSFTYDSLTGDLLSIIKPLIGSTGLSDYDGAGRVGKVTDVNGQSRGFTYDARGRITTITNEADGSSSTISYDTAGQPTSMTDEDGVTRTFDYDTTYGRLVRITDLEGNYIAYAYDAQGNRIEMSKHDPLGARTSRRRWSYEHPVIPGKLWKEINANDSFTEYGYDSEANITSMKDANGNTVYYAYDPLNRLTSVTQPGNITTTYTYDTHGNLTSVTDAEGHTTTYECGDMGRLVSTTSPDTGTVTYVYDAAGNPVRKTDAKAITVLYTYDLLNRLTALHFPDPTQDIIYAYDAGPYGKGRRTGMTDPSGYTTFGYDARGRLAQKISTVNGQNYTFGQTYSPGGRVMTVTYPTGRTLDYTRDSMGRMEGLSTTYDTSTVTLVSNMTYNPFGNPKGLSTGAGGEVYNQSGECECIEVANPGEQMERIYTYDNNRNLTDIHGTNTPWYNQSFAYDALNRLTSAEGRYGVIGYTYDNVGNRLTRTVNDETQTYTYIPATDKLDQITGANPISFAYDANGNTTGIDNRVLTYNQNNRLIRVEENSVVLGEYTYNGLGQRVTKTVDGVTTVFHYDLSGKLITESQADGTITAEYLYMGKIRIAKLDVSAGNIYYYLNDRLGTPQIMTDHIGTVAWEASYRPFGEASVNPRSEIVNNFRFPGQYYDQETGLHYNYHRYYDPRTGRYLRPDPIGFITVSLNPFRYANGNPISNIDPFGLFTIEGMNCAEKSRKIIPSISSGAPVHSYSGGKKVICEDIIIEDTITCVCIGYWQEIIVDLYKRHLSYEVTYICCGQDDCGKENCREVKRIEHEEPAVVSEYRYKRLPGLGKVYKLGTPTAAFSGCSACLGGVGAPM